MMTVVLIIKKPAYGYLMIVPTIFTCAPFFTTIYDHIQVSTGNPVFFTNGGRSLRFAIVGITLLIVGSLICLAKTFKDNANIVNNIYLGFVIAGVMSFFAIFYQAGDRSTRPMVVNFDAIRNDVKDIECDSNFIIAYGNYEGSTIRYRCPTGIVLNPYALLPFIPWPDYHDGSSVDLKKKLIQ